MFIQTHAFDYHRASAGDPTKRIVRSEREFWDVIRYLEKFPSLGYDVETSGTAYFRHARICGAGFGVRNPDGPGTLCWYAPFRHQTGEPQLPAGTVLAGMRILLENARIEKICHNAKFERHMARADGIEIVGPTRDTMLEAHLYDENFLVGLKDRVSRDLNDPALRAHEIVLESVLKERAKETQLGIREYKDHFGYAQVPINLCGTYACYDVDGTLRLADFYDSRGVRQFFAQTYATEIELSKVLFEMEEYGVPVDVPYLNSLKDQTRHAMAMIAPQVFSACGFQFNIGSDDELRHVLIHRLGAQLTKRTKGYNAFDVDPFADDDEGTYAVDKEVLEQLAPQLPVCGLILEWRQAQKISSTYTDSILKRLDANHILHGDFKQNGTNTGRLSAEKPNMQNFAGDSDKRALAFSGKKLEDGGRDPWSVKRAFTNRDQRLCRGYWDYSQIELRVLAQYSADPTMIDVYAKGEDIHNRTSQEVFDTLEKAMRRHAKVINFGLSYCLERDTAILTSRGTVPIQDVLPSDLLWDGLEWVSHDGVIYKGEQEVVEHGGVSATSGHEVFTEDGRKVEHGQAHREGAVLARGASGAVPLGYAGPFGACETGEERQRALDALRRGEVLDLSGKPVVAPVERHVGEDDDVSLPTESEVRERPARRDFGAAVRRYGAAVREGHACLVASLQGARDQGALHVARALHSVGVEEVAGLGLQGLGVRQEEQRWSLHATELAARDTVGELAEPTPSRNRKAPVYDILNAGPRNRFCANGKIVSNCMSAAGFARQAKIPLPDAERHMAKFFQKYPRIAPFREEFWKHVADNAGSFMNLFGRPRRVPGLLSGDKRLRARSQRQTIGSLIQGTAAELTKISLVRLFHWEQQNRAGLRLCSTIHDEISADMPFDDRIEIARAVKHMMEDFHDVFTLVPIETDVEYSTTNWSEKQKLKLNAPETK